MLGIKIERINYAEQRIKSAMLLRRMQRTAEQAKELHRQVRELGLEVTYLLTGCGEERRQEPSKTMKALLEYLHRHDYEVSQDADQNLLQYTYAKPLSNGLYIGVQASHASLAL